VDIKLFVALLFGKIISGLLIALGKGATAAPGLYALKVDPSLIEKVLKRNNIISSIISGTNGKTTTARIASHLLSGKFKIIHNRQGSNLLRGIASTIIKKASFYGKLNENLAVWEVDEAVLPQTVKVLKPSVLVLLNIFRDQLDRYGEIDTIRDKWQKAINSLPNNALIIANADDPSISSLLTNAKQEIVYFGIGDSQVSLPQISNVSDVKLCPICLNRLSYDAIFSSHMGSYYCINCSFQRPKANLVAKNIKFSKAFSSTFELTQAKSKISIKLDFPGLFNIYNFLAAACLAKQIGITLKEINDKTSKFTTAFGRSQKISVANKSIIILLIKNPTGTNEVLRAICTNEKINILAILNDKIADGKDVSWIWDASWESLSNKTNLIQISGTRARDLALRFKYANISVNTDNVHEDIYYSLKHAINLMDNNTTLYILPTYTAMLEVQKNLAGMGAIAKWHKN